MAVAVGRRLWWWCRSWCFVFCSWWETECLYSNGNGGELAGVMVSYQKVQRKVTVLQAFDSQNSLKEQQKLAPLLHGLTWGVFSFLASLFLGWGCADWPLSSPAELLIVANPCSRGKAAPSQHWCWDKME